MYKADNLAFHSTGSLGDVVQWFSRWSSEVRLLSFPHLSQLSGLQQPYSRISPLEASLLASLSHIRWFLPTVIL